jgi:hypothetical protein
VSDRDVTRPERTHRRVVRDTRVFQHIARCAPRRYRRGGQRHLPVEGARNLPSRQVTLGSYPPRRREDWTISSSRGRDVRRMASEDSRRHFVERTESRARPLLAGFIAYTFRTISARPSSLRCSFRSIASGISLKRLDVSRCRAFDEARKEPARSIVPPSLSC